MTGDDLLLKVRRTVLNSSVEEDDIYSLFNEGLIDITSRVLIPALEAIGTVDTVVGESEVATPEGYQRGLFDCQDASGLPVGVVASKRQLLAKYGNLAFTGDVRHVCAPDEDRVIYAPIPTEVSTLTLSYYEYPAVVKSSTSPVCLPSNFHRALFHYAVFSLFDDIEQGEEGEKVNTMRHEGRYEAMVTKIALFFKEGKSHPKPPVTVGEYM